MSDKIFIGGVKVINTKYGELLKLSIPEKDFTAHAKNGWLNVTLKKGKDSGKHYMELDTFEPQGKPKDEEEF